MTGSNLISEMTGDQTKSWIRMKHPESVKKTLEQLIQGGDSKLQFIVDFDYTMTRAHNKHGEKVDCSWGVIENSPLLPKDYTSQTNALKAKYLLIEHDHNMKTEDKMPYMVEWYKKANKLLQEFSVNKNMFPKMVSASNVEFRDKTDELMSSLNQYDIPCLILSAGLGDLVLEICKANKVMNDNVKVVSNFLAYDEEGRVTGIDGEMIHVFNKNESAIHDSPYFQKLQHRHNIILIGDSLGDLRMADGVENVENILKIGFLNANIEERLEQFIDKFDIVLVDDQTMDIPIWILNKVLAK